MRNLPPALLAEWPGSFSCHSGNTGVEWTLNKSQHTKLTRQKKIFLPLLPEFELATFRSKMGRFTNKLSRLPGIACGSSQSTDPYIRSQQRDTANAEIKALLYREHRAIEGLSVKPVVGQLICLHARPAARNPATFLRSAIPVHSTSFICLNPPWT